mgnify:FL=1
MQYNMNQNKLMQMMMMQALKQVPPELLAMVEEEARKRGMSDEDINAGKAYINQVQKGVEK